MVEEKETKTFLATVSAEAEEKLREEAKAMMRSRNAQLAYILEERYGLLSEQQPQAA